MSSLLLDTNGQSTHGLLPGGLGYSAWTTPAGITADTSGGLKTTGLGMMLQNVAKQEVTFSFRYRCDVRGLGANPFWNYFIASGSPGVWLRLNQKNSGKVSMTVQNGAAATNSVDSTTVLNVGAEYWLTGYARTDGTTWRMRLQIRNAADTILETMNEITLAGQVATEIPALRTGVDSSSTATQAYHHCRMTDSWLDWPIGAHVSDDTEPGTPITSYQPSWIDNPSFIPANEITTGINAPWLGTYAAPLVQHYLDAEGAAIMNRHANFFTVDYTPVQPPPNLYVARRLLNGTLFGDGISRVPIISGLGFDGFTTDWPAGGLNDFISGAMDTTLQKWADLFDTQLPADANALFLWRPWREMNSFGTIYGPRGATIAGGHQGLNETDADFITAWRYIRAFMFAHTTVARFRLAWCPQVGDGAGGLATTAALAQRFPGGSYTKWVMPTGYISPGRTAAAAFANAYAGWNEGGGSIANNPFGVSETQVDRTDPSRVAHLNQYAADFTAMPWIRTTNFWNCIMTCQYPVIDQAGDGFVAAFQSLIANPPFLGEPVVRIDGTATGTSATSATATGVATVHATATGTSATSATAAGVASGGTTMILRTRGTQLWIEAL